ncbi:carbon-nitrogen hydrolase family protein [Janibacter cremeus]|uniref:Putative amidohydrolase n=1 Tax=Janibacter cremeus TaxID=1285192 RepID=A0A852VNJ6_9MICO|nr:carbon-nitrogen hydrolase family protein [Janibacter cremeus]NYF97258.1 putative amidohydrolase [Janibacter cremeus]
MAPDSPSRLLRHTSGQRLRLAGAQFTATGDPSENLRTIADLTARAAERGARLVVHPEAAMASFAGRLDTVAEPLDGRFADGVRALAHEHGVTVVVGMFTPADAITTDEGGVLRCDGGASKGRDRTRVHNTLLVTGPGTSETTYRKVHLYDAFGSKESDTVAPGDELVTVDVEGWTVGLATCYDVRFGEQFTQLGRRGAELVVLPASWGDGPGKASQWDLLTRARAHDAQAWLLAVGQAWTKDAINGPFGIGRSALADPTGEVRARLGGGEDVLVADIDRGSVERTRATVPLL